MTSLLILAPLIAAGMGLTVAAGLSFANRDRRIHFVSKGHLEEELDKFDVEVEDTEHCEVCGDEIESNDVGAVIKDNGDYIFVCKKPTCLDTYDLE